MAHDDVAARKAVMRRSATAKRESLDDGSGTAAAEVARRAGEMTDLAPVPSPIVSIYAAIGAELDPGPLLYALEARGWRGALPVIGRKGEALTFRAYASGDELDERMWGIREPRADRPVVVPDILILPLLAFDREGWRLGYGGGFYDRTLEALRAQKTVVAIGLAYDRQQMDAVPHADYDEPMDAVLTPSGLMKFSR